MIIYPAIDIQNGKVVRLRQGKFADVTEYHTDPVAVAQHWAGEGAQWLHVVDLDGAQAGSPQNILALSNIVRAVKIPVQCGGGIRTEADICRLLEAGVYRVILGTKVIEDRIFLKSVLSQWPDRCAVSLDCQDGIVMQRGWTAPSTLEAVAFARELQDLGVQLFVYTDIARDGMLTGPNIPALESLLAAVDVPVIASGGISKLEDITALLGLKARGLSGAITGKALYEETLDLRKAIALCSTNE